MSALARAGYTVSSAPSSAAAAPVLPPTFPPNTQTLQTPNYALAIPAGGELTAQTLLRHVQQSGTLDRWIGDMEEEACNLSNGGTSADGLSAFEERLLSRLLTFVDRDPEVRAVLAAAERADAPAKLHELVRDVNQRCQRTVLATSQPASRSHYQTASIMPELHSRCSDAFYHVNRAHPRPNDPTLLTRADSERNMSRAELVLTSAAEQIVLAAQNDEVQRSNKLHETAATMRIVL